MFNRNLEELEAQIGYHFNDRELLAAAVTHTSYANEHRRENIMNNERLEYLGDAILDFAAADYLYRRYPDRKEGDLSKMRASRVSEQPLAKCGRDLHLPDFLRLGKGEEQTGGRNRDSIISDAVEAVIGAVYLDGGFEPARNLVLTRILLDQQEEDLFTDRRTPLQELFQDRQKQIEYRIVGESGPPHDRIFETEAYVDGVLIGRGSGKTKKSSAQSAAQDALERLHVSEID